MFEGAVPEGTYDSIAFATSIESGEIGIFRSGANLWALRGLTRIYFGFCLDRPQPADYDGDLADDLGIFRQSAGLWSVKVISRLYYGTAGDVPVTR